MFKNLIENSSNQSPNTIIGCMQLASHRVLLLNVCLKDMDSIVELGVDSRSDEWISLLQKRPKDWIVRHLSDSSSFSSISCKLCLESSILVRISIRL